MSRTRRLGRAALVLVITLTSTSTSAHHGSADYHVDREITVRGTVAEWKWSNPHIAIVLTVSVAGGRQEKWDGEGPPLTWAAARGWSGTTLHAGEAVALVMYPSRHGPRAGLVKRIERANGEILRVSRPWLD